MQDLLVLGVAEGKRMRGLQAAAQRHGGVRVHVADYAEVIRDPGAFHARAATGMPLKIDSPGDDPWVQHQLMLRGCKASGGRPQAAPTVPVAAGDFMPTSCWYAGFAALLRALPPTAAPLTPVDDILLMTDKLACQQQLRALGVPTPPLLGPVTGHAHLVALLDDAGVDSVFIKPRYGSSAAGVVAYRRNRRGDETAMTTMQRVDGRYVNSKRVQRHVGRTIAALIDTLAADDAYVEAWIPKPRTAGGHFDFRVVMIDGEPQHRIARVNDAPMTNLHLDARRASVDEVLDGNGVRALLDTARAAARAFPRSHLMGLDILVRGERAWVLEVNAFGDLLPRLLWAGRDTYEAQLQARFPGSPPDDVSPEPVAANNADVCPT
jgi:glutathione synthase/RimK-type ligase-like ATP-grasp enzyme